MTTPKAEIEHKFKIIITEYNAPVDRLKISAICHKLIGDPNIFDSDLAKLNKGTIHQKDITINIEDRVIKVTDAPDRIVYFITLVSKDYDDVSSRRKNLVALLKKDFRFITVTQDDISKIIAQKCYSKIYEIENQMRSFVSNYMIVNVAPKWFPLIVPDDISKLGSIELELKKRNENNYKNIFLKDTQNELYNMDFSDLGKIIYSFRTHAPKSYDTIASKATEIKDMEELKAFQKSLNSNYDRYFSIFKDDKFDVYWKELSNYRNRIAHNGIFEDSDLVKITDNCNKIRKIIDKANEDLSPKGDDSFSANIIGEILEALNFDEEDAPETRKIDDSNYSEISEDEFLGLLSQSVKYFQKVPNGYVGKKKFGKHLITKGYSYQSYLNTLKILLEKGKVTEREVELSADSVDDITIALDINYEAINPSSN